MAVKYFCDCCGSQMDISEEYSDTQASVSFFTRRKPRIFNNNLSGSEISTFRQSLCDKCKTDLIYDLDNFMKEVRRKYSLSESHPNYDWGFSLLSEGNEVEDE